jgi:hypothetical protein
VAASSPLEHIAAHGVVESSVGQVQELIAQLRGRCRELDDKRCCAFADAVLRLEDWRNLHDAAGGVPEQTLGEIDDAIRAAAVTALASGGESSWRDALDRVELLLGGAETWEKRGQARRLEGD